MGNKVFEFLEIQRVIENSPQMLEPTVFLGFNGVEKLLDIDSRKILLPRLSQKIFRLLGLLAPRISQYLLNKHCVDFDFRNWDDYLRIFKRCFKSDILTVESNGPAPMGVIHWRRGDYLSWPSEAFPAALTHEWILTAMHYVEGRLGRVTWSLITDDPLLDVSSFDWGHFCVTTFVSEDEISAISKMAQADALVLSPSTFSLLGILTNAAGRDAAKEDSHCNQPLYVAPKFWIGHRSLGWQPKHLNTHLLPCVFL